MPDQSLLGSLNPRGDLAEYKRRKAYDSYDAELQLPQGQMGGGGSAPQPAPMPQQEGSQLQQLGGPQEEGARQRRLARLEKIRARRKQQKQIEEWNSVAKEWEQAKIVGVGGGAAGEQFFPLSNLAPQTREALIDFMRDAKGNKVPVSGFNLGQLSDKAKGYLFQLQALGERQSPNNRFETQGQ